MHLIVPKSFLPAVPCDDTVKLFMVGTFFLRIRAQNTYFIQNTYTIFDIPQFWQRLKRLQRFRAAFHTQYALLGLRRRPADKKLKPYNQS